MNNEETVEQLFYKLARGLNPENPDDGERLLERIIEVNDVKKLEDLKEFLLYCAKHLPNVDDPKFNNRVIQEFFLMVEKAIQEKRRKTKLSY